MLFILGQWRIPMKDPYGLSQATIPAGYAHLLLEVLADRGLDSALVLKDSSLPGSLFTNPDARLTPRQWSRLVLTALRLCDDDGLGYDYGLRLRPTAHGVLGYALMSAPTLGEAFGLCAAFLGMRLRDYRFSLQQEREYAVIALEETHPVVGGAPADAQALRRFFHECLLIGGVHAARFLLQRDMAGLELYVDWPEPAYHKRYRATLPLLHFAQAHVQIRFLATELAATLTTADPLTYRQALAFCEMERARFGQEAAENLVQRVRAELALLPGEGFPGLGAVATRLHMSARTLKRRLSALNVNFLQLLEQARQQEAENLLSTTTYPIQEVAGLLGYAGPANFTRAFRKWTGQTPTEFRARLSDS